MEVNWGFYYFHESTRWLDPLLQLIGLGISIRAYRVSRKTGYLILAVYFFLAACSLTVIPKIKRAIYERQHPQTELSEEMKEKYAAELTALSNKYYPPHPPPVWLTINFPLGSVILITGICLLAKQEARRNTEQAIEANIA